jgi:hypothetical protein
MPKKWWRCYVENVMTFIDHNLQHSSSLIEGLKKNKNQTKFIAQIATTIHWGWWLQMLGLTTPLWAP